MYCLEVGLAQEHVLLRQLFGKRPHGRNAVQQPRPCLQAAAYRISSLCAGAQQVSLYATCRSNIQVAPVHIRGQSGLQIQRRPQKRLERKSRYRMVRSGPRAMRPWRQRCQPPLQKRPPAQLQAARPVHSDAPQTGLAAAAAAPHAPPATERQNGALQHDTWSLELDVH